MISKKNKVVLNVCQKPIGPTHILVAKKKIQWVLSVNLLKKCNWFEKVSKYLNAFNNFDKLGAI